MRGLVLRAFAGLVFLVAVLAASLFLPAWTAAWWQAWAFLGVFGGSTLAVTLWLVRHDPKLLERRVAAGPVAEQSGVQKLVQSAASLSFVAIFVVASLDRRFGWSAVPTALAVAGDALVALGLGFVFLVFRENSFTSATIEVARDQRVVSTGPYALVRHPMYLGALWMLTGTALALGSWWALVPVAAVKAVIVWRLLDEERFLDARLPGYAEYRTRVRWRLVPRVW